MNFANVPLLIGTGVGGAADDLPCAPADAAAEMMTAVRVAIISASFDLAIIESSRSSESNRMRSRANGRIISAVTGIFLCLVYGARFEKLIGGKPIA